jgi:hypothetical protein
MTITARRMLAAIVAVSVLGTGMALAQNSVPYSNDFESATLYAPATNMANWSSTTDDQSMVTNMTYSYGGTLPSWPSGTAKILKLNTQGAILTNNLVSTSATNGIYMDTMVQFVPSDTTPATCTTGDTYNVKLAIFANASSNLVVYHGYDKGSSALGSNGLTVLPNVMDAAQWYRLTVRYKFHTDGNNSAAMFQVKVDGVLITNSAAYADGWETYLDTHTGAWPPSLDPNGTWFLASESANRQNVTAVAFQGTGYIDDLLVSTSDPFAGYINYPSALTAYPNYTSWLQTYGLPLNGSGYTPDGTLNGSAFNSNLVEPYLLNVNPGDTTIFNIASVSYTGTAVDVTVQLKTNGGGHAAALYGTLKLKSDVDVGGSFTTVDGTAGSLPGGTKMFTVPVEIAESNLFYKAIVE